MMSFSTFKKQVKSTARISVKRISAKMEGRSPSSPRNGRNNDENGQDTIRKARSNESESNVDKWHLKLKKWWANQPQRVQVVLLVLFIVPALYVVCVIIILAAQGNNGRVISNNNSNNNNGNGGNGGGNGGIGIGNGGDGADAGDDGYTIPPQPTMAPTKRTSYQELQSSDCRKFGKVNMYLNGAFPRNFNATEKQIIAGVFEETYNELFLNASCPNVYPREITSARVTSSIWNGQQQPPQRQRHRQRQLLRAAAIEEHRLLQGTGAADSEFTIETEWLLILQCCDCEDVDALFPLKNDQTYSGPDNTHVLDVFVQSLSNQYLEWSTSRTIQFGYSGSMLIEYLNTDSEAISSSYGMRQRAPQLQTREICNLVQYTEEDKGGE